MANAKRAISRSKKLDTRGAKIEALVKLVKHARDDVNDLDLKFEAYLLDMAVLALKEQIISIKGDA